MDRKLFLAKCQKCAMLQGGIQGTKIDVPEELQVLYNGCRYYPHSYELRYNEKGRAVHVAVIHDILANCIVRCSLESVEDLGGDKDEKP